MDNNYISKSKAPHKAMRRTLGVKLFARRQELQLTQRYVYRKTGVKPWKIDRAEIGKGNVLWGDIVTLLNFYGRTINFETLLTESV